MGVYSGKVVNGRVEVRRVLLPGGTKVTILVPHDEEDEDDFWVSPRCRMSLISRLLRHRGEGIPAEVVLTELRARTQALRAGAKK